MNNQHNVFSFVKLGTAVALAVAFSSHAIAGPTATATATYEVLPITEIALTGAGPVLTVTSAVAGAAPTAVTASQTYAVTTNQNAKITASIDTNMPTGMVLTASMAPPAGATGDTVVALTSAPQDMVTGIAALNQANMALTYGLSATAAAGVVTSASKTVTYTITAI
jgi:hypothetical protein